MQGERRRDRDALINQYGLSVRLVSRVLALLARKIDITPTILEMAASDESYARLLLDRSLMASPEEIGTDWLCARAEELDLPDADLLRVVEGENGWRTMALEDDILAEQVEEESVGGEEGEVTSMIRAPGGEISRGETRELFTSEDVARLKLTALTSQESGERIEALRRLIYAPMDGGNKAGVFVRVLIDPAAKADVRREAARSLQQIGFREELAETLRQMFEARDEDVLYAIRRLDALLEDAGESEQGVALAVILQIFEESNRPDVLRELLGLVSDAAPVLSGSRQKTEQFIQVALRKLTRFYGRLSGPVESTLGACHRAAPEVVKELLWKELERTSDASVHAFLIHFLSGVAREAEDLERLAKAAVEEILNPDLPEEQRTQLRYGLVRMGEPAVEEARRRLPSAGGRRSAELVRLMDVVCTEGEMSRGGVNRAVEGLLDSLQVAERMTRRRIVESSVIADSRAAPELQQRVAGELLSHMTEFRMKNTIETMCHTLEQIGPPAMVPLVEFVRRRYPREDVEEPFRTLGRIARKYGDELPEAAVEEAIELCMGLLEGEKPGPGTFVVALGHLVGYTSAGADRFEQVLEKMEQKTDEAGFVFDAFEALGVMAGSPNAAPAHQRELFELFRQVLHMKTPRTLGAKRETVEGTVYEFGAEVMFDIRLLPAVVQGLEQIGISPQTPPDLRRDVVKEMLVLWEGVSNVRVVWGPGAIDSLVQAICRVACNEHVAPDMRARLGRSILRFLNKISVVRSMGEICSHPAEEEHMRQLCVEAGERMMEEWEECEEQDDERRVALLRSLARAAANRGLDPDNEEVRRLRENVIATLFQALREGIEQVREPLEWLRDCPDLTDKQRADIRDRLSRVFGLVHAAEQ